MKNETLILLLLKILLYYKATSRINQQFPSWLICDSVSSKHDYFPSPRPFVEQFSPRKMSFKCSE